MFFIGRGDLRSPAGVHRTPLQLWRFESVHGFASVGNLYQKMHFAGSNPAIDPKWNEIVRCTMKSSLRSDEIFGVPPQMKLNPPPSPAVRQISSRSDFIHRRWISSDIGGFSWKKHLRKQVLFSVSGIGIRTPTNRVRVCRATFTQYRYNAIYYNKPSIFCQYLSGKISQRKSHLSLFSFSGLPSVYSPCTAWKSQYCISDVKLTIIVLYYYCKIRTIII